MFWSSLYFTPPENNPHYSALQETIKDWVSTLLYVVVCYIAFTTIFFEAYQIPTGSMEPTLHGDMRIHVGDRVIAQKWISNYWPLKRGDIAIFISAEDQQTFIVKRVVGLPGDKIQIKPPYIYVNDKKVDDPEVFRHFYLFDLPLSEKPLLESGMMHSVEKEFRRRHHHFAYPLLTEVEDGVWQIVVFNEDILKRTDGRIEKRHTYILKEAEDAIRVYQLPDYIAPKGIFAPRHGGYALERPFTVPQDSYFVLGDNSASSNDSRYWGHLPKRQLLGRALMTFWPPSRSKVLRSSWPNKE